jgi:hypothetical protein
MAAGRPFGSHKEKAFTDALRVAVNRTTEDGKKKLYLIADRLVSEALAGESWAIQQVADRLDGKPAQESTVTMRNVTAREVTDEELDDIIAARGSGGEETPPTDPSQLN